MDAIDLAACLARIPHLGCHGECAPSVPGGRDGSGRICRECARALGIELLFRAGYDPVVEARREGWDAGYRAGVQRGAADTLAHYQIRNRAS
jgi:hypothetical protein